MADETRAERAEQLFLSGANCAQSVFLAFSDLVGLDEGTMLRLSSGLGGGMGGMRDTCGAVSAMFLVVGQLFGDENFANKEAKAELYAMLQAMARDFEKENSSLKCRELLSNVKNLQSAPSERTPEYYKTRPCARFVGSAARLIERYAQQRDASE